MKIDAWRQHTDFLRFAVIGGVNTLVHGAILTLAIEKFQLQLLSAHVLAFWFANLFSYVANSRITFHRPLSGLRYVRFVAASLVSLCLTLGIAWATNYFGVHYRVGFSIIVVTVPVFSFFIIKFWAFAGPHSSSSPSVPEKNADA